MPNRIEATFAKLRAENRAAFIPYICAGDPTLAQTVRIAGALIEAGADLLELGVPFSDPLADGVVNQLAAQRALNAGATIRGVLDCVAEIRKNSDRPVVLYTYLNPIVQFGWEAFHAEANRVGVDGLLILDLPPDEEYRTSNDVAHIRLVAPTTSSARLAQIAKHAAGFIYYVSREGVTGVRDQVAGNIPQMMTRIRAHAKLPTVVGFGISTRAQVAEVAAHADGVVVGSALVNCIRDHLGERAKIAPAIAARAADLSAGVRLKKA